MICDIKNITYTRGPKVPQNDFSTIIISQLIPGGALPGIFCTFTDIFQDQERDADPACTLISLISPLYILTDQIQ